MNVAQVVTYNTISVRYRLLQYDVLTGILEHSLEACSQSLSQHWCELNLLPTLCAQQYEPTPLIIQPAVLMNRFMINLKSLVTPGSSLGGSARQLSSIRFSVPNFHIPVSFLGNIGQDLQHGQEPTDEDDDGDQELDVGLTMRRSSEAESVETSTTPGSHNPRAMAAAAQVSVRAFSGSKHLNRTPLHFRLIP